MKKITVFLSIVFLSLSYTISKAETRIKISDDVKNLRELNTEEKIKFKNIEGLSTQSVPKQYKGKLKHKKRKEEFHFMDARFYLGAALRYSMASDLTLKTSKTDSQIQSETGQSSTIYYDKEKISLDDTVGYAGSVGLYWRNGFRTELEFSRSKYTTNDINNLYIDYDNQRFWQYLGSGDTLYQNQSPISELEFTVSTTMLNFIFEQFSDRSKIVPYIGFGVGMISSDVKSLPNDGSARGLAGQGMVGLSYQIGHKGSFYFGYRYIQSETLDQTFTRVVQIQKPSGYQAYTIKSPEEYVYKSHNIETGLRFFF